MRNQVEIFGIDHNGQKQIAHVDKESNGIVVIEGSHERIHAGKAYKAHYSLETAATDDHRTGIAFTTPAISVGELHMLFEFGASVDAEAFVIEGQTMDSDPGANVAPINRNRNSSNTSGIGSLETTPTLNEVTTLNEAQFAAATFSGGTELDYTLLVAGDGPHAIGGDDRGSQEFELKASTKYVAYIQNLSASANIHFIELDWYEAD